MNKNQFIKTQLKKQNFLSYSGVVKYANACIGKLTFAYLTAPVKKLNCLDNALCFFVLVKSYCEKDIKSLILP